MAACYMFALIGFVLLNTSTTYDLFLVATTKHIRYFNMSDPDDPGTYIPLKDLGTVVAMDYDPVEDHVYWTDVTRHTISRARRNGDEQEVLVSDVLVADGLTLDVSSRMMYWTDTGKDTIERAFMNGTNRETLVTIDLEEPRAIVLNKHLGKMYWTDWGPSIRRIQRANLDGSEREVLVNTTLTNPFGLDLDLEEDRMYWAEAWLDNFESADLNGDDRKLIYHEDGINPFSIALHEQFIYWSDWNKRNVQRINRYTKQNVTEVVLTTGYKMLGLKAFAKDGLNILLVGDVYEIRQVNLDVDKHLGEKINLTPGKQLPIAIEYDPEDDVIYWCDVQYKGIWNVYRNGSDERSLVTEDVNYPAGLALSWETDELFWTDSNLKLINKLTLSDNKRITIVNTDIESPQGIAVDMLNRHIYWADASRGKIERASYEGQERQLIAKGLSLPTAIVLDLDNSLIYWNEYGASVIKEAKLDGTEARVIASPVQSLAMTILGNYIYWTDNVKNYTGRVNRFTRSEFSPVLLRERFMGIRILQDISDCIQSPCQNGGSCLPEMNGYKCQCVFGFTGTNCETALQQCGISPCLHNGICVVVGSNPRCICQDGCYGDICQYDTLLITHLAPNVGPIAGGTKITLIGEEFPASDARITIGDVASCNTLTSNSTTIIAITPPVIQKYAEKERQIFVQFPGLDLNFSTEYNFTFKADPKVTSVYPLETIEKGGTRLTVAGDHFDSVEKPLLKVDKVDQTIEISGNTTSVINETITTYYEECTRLSVILLICITPDIDVSDTTIFLNRRRRDVISERANLYQLEGFDSWKVLRARRKRETRLETRQLLYIGIILDGVNRFKNLSANHNTRIYGRLTLISPPEFSGSTKNELFQFHRGEPLDIKGSDIDKLSIDDYTIDVGSTRCSVISITKNSLHCMPPQKEPPKDKRSPPKGHLIVVHIGTRVQKPVGILEYPFNRLLYIGIGVAVVVVFVFIVITILVCLRQRNTKRRNVRGREGVISVINLPPVLPEYSPETRRRIPNTTMDMSPISPVPEHDVITSGNHNYVSVYRPPEHVYQALMTSTFNRSSETETEDNIYQGLPQTNKLNKRRQVTSQYPE